MIGLRPALAGLLIGCAICGSVAATGAGRKSTVAVWVVTRDGRQVEGEAEIGKIGIEVDGRPREIGAGDILSVTCGAAAGGDEQARIGLDLIAAAGNDHVAMERAIDELTDIGLPVMSPLLATYKDTDRHEPQPVMRLFPKIVPGYADRLDRTLDMVRLASGETLRGHVKVEDLRVKDASGDVTVPIGNLRRLAVRRRSIDRMVDVDALRHCTPIEFLDTGLRVTSGSRVEIDAQGFTRLSFDIDGWASDPDGIKVPGPNYKTNLVDGFAFGALIGRVGPAGPRWLAGRHVQKSNLITGRLYLAVNDNGHWQNNLGSYRVRLRAADAYDIGDAQ